MDAKPEREPEINKIFRLASKHGASDLYLYAGSAPRVKLRGVVRHIELPPFTPEGLEWLVAPILYPEQRQRLAQGEEVAFTYAFEEGQAYHVAVASKGGPLSLAAHRLGAR